MASTHADDQPAHDCAQRIAEPACNRGRKALQPQKDAVLVECRRDRRHRLLAGDIEL